MTKPDPALISVPHGADDIAALLDDLFVKPRVLIRRWAEITQQTAQARLAYTGQHLASVVTGVAGMGTAARGEDLVDGSEVKSCSKADQLGRCKVCEAAVPGWMLACPACGSEDLTRKDDSHWIISVRREEELRQLVASRRIVLVMFDRSAESLLDIRVRAWEIWPGEELHTYFGEFVTDYFENNYMAKRAANLDPAPCNLHPLKFDHLMMNPLKVLDATIRAPDQPDASVEVEFLVSAEADRAELEPEPLPVRLCKKNDLAALVDNVDPESFAPCLRQGRSVDEVEAALRARDPVSELGGFDESRFAAHKRESSTPAQHRHPKIAAGLPHGSLPCQR